ncbi:MAG TPA: hypothetical protein VF459_03260 [Caulobacteraceae bacterium]
MARVLIKCPLRERPTPTGYWMNATQFAAAGARYAFRCGACNEIHHWERADAWLEGDAPRREAPASEATASASAGGAG